MAGYFAKRIHKYFIGYRMRCTTIINTFHIAVVVNPVDNTKSILDVHPAIHLPATALRAAKAKFEQVKIGYYYPATAQRYGHTQRHFSGKGSTDVEKSFFPLLAYLYAEIIFYCTGVFILGPIGGVPVNGGRRSVYPKFWRSHTIAYGFA